MKRILLRSLLLLFVLIVAAIGAAYWQLSLSLPQLDGVVAAAPLHDSVRIERDAAGIPVIRATSRHDLAYATGFVHGQDRFFQMDLSRRRAAGELAELYGPLALRIDTRTRLHRFRSRAKDVIRQTAAADLEILEAYTAGVNAGLGSLGARPFEYLLLRAKPQPWRLEDGILVGYAMFLTLNDERAIREVRRGYVQRVMPPAVFDWLYPRGTGWDAPIVGKARSPVEIPGPELIDLRSFRAAGREAAAVSREDGNIPGSNNWAVAGKLTQTGRAIVANDMHLDITTPNIFYRARFVVEGKERRDVSGLTLPGTPVMIAGSNGSVAWAFTNSYGDWSDAVIINAGPSPGSYMTADGLQQIQRFTETIVVNGQDARELVIRETQWGPILDDQPWPDGEIAVRWIAHDPLSINFAQVDLETAATLDQALDVANRMGIPPQNFVAGDTDGNIGWTIAGRIPQRSDYDAWLPADWSTGNGWVGWYHPDSYPRVVNPESGRIWTANARVVDGDALAIVGDGGYSLGARAMQIRDGLFASETFEPLDMLDIQIDDRALFLERWRELVLATLSKDAMADKPLRAEFRNLVEDWIPRASVDSVGYRLVREFRNEVRGRVFDMLLAPVRAQYEHELRLRINSQFEAPLWQLLTERPAHLLSADYASWEELLLQAIDSKLEHYLNNFDGDLADRIWGERNTAAIRHPLSFALSALSAWLDMPREPLAGDNNMPRVQGPAFGASERFAVSPGSEENGYLHMPAGQSGHPMSDYYNVGHSAWVQGRPSPFLPGNARHVLTLQPTG